MTLWLDAFFRPAPPSPLETAMAGTHAPGLIVLSVFVAMLASLGALMIAQRLATARRLAWAVWLLAGAVSMGGGIWSMHFIGMLAFSLPCGVSYDVGTTMLSALPGMLASAVALTVIGRPQQAGLKELCVGAVLMGAGIGAMHYAGMAAMRLDGFLRYDAGMVLVSVVVAVALAFVSLGIRRQAGRSTSTRQRTLTMLASAAVMGAAVAGMHYTAMSAAVFFPTPNPDGVGMSLPPTTLAILIVVFAVSMAMTTMAAAFAGQQVETSRALREEVGRRLALEHEAKAGEARLQAIFDTVVDGVVTIDSRGIVQRWSPSAARMFGYRVDEVVGRNVSMLMPEPDRSAHDGYLRHFLDTGEARIIGIGRETTGRRKTGEEFPLELSISQVRLGDELLFTGIVRDVTERKRVQRELEDAVRGADAANRAKSAFVANVSHEIRTPLNAIMGMAHILLRSGLAPGQRDQAAKILQAGRSLLSIINDILDFSKIEAGQLAIEAIPMDLEQVLRGVTDMVVERAAAKGLELVLDVGTDLPSRLVGDPLRLGQILLNYANNAIKFTDSGEIKLTVRDVGRGGSGQDGSGQGSGMVLRFTVSDTGIGLSEEARARLFQPFQQADVSITRRFGGTGLGLVICKRLAELMGGTVGVDSRPGEGSSFWLEVPLGLAADAGPRPLPVLGMRGRRALVVEDNDSTRAVIGDMLRSMTFEVEEAEGGDRAVELVRAAVAAGRPFDIVFADWRMPGRDGLETVKAIRRLSDGPAMPAFVLVTAYGGHEIMHRAAQAAVEEVLFKPVNPSTLLDAATRALGMVVDAAALIPQLPEDAAARSLAGLRILVAEDNPLNQDVVRELLTSAGAGPDIVDDGAAALGRLAAYRYDLVLMDMQMPVMDGLEATRRIRADGGLAGVPVVAMTANAMEADRRACLEAGMDDHLSKPIDPEELYAMVGRWALRPPAAAEPAAPLPPAAPAGRAAALLPPPPPFDRLAPEIDAASALKRVLNNAAMYRSMLGRFQSDQRDTGQRLASALEAGEAAGAELLVHSLKGVAGQIGAMALADAAAVVESLVRAGACGAQPLVRLGEELARVLVAIDRAMPEPEPEAAAAGGPNTAAAGIDIAGGMEAECGELLHRLATMLAEDDPEAQSLLRQEGTALQAALGRDAYGRLAGAVERFDFDEALELVRSLPFHPAPEPAVPA
ncbi:response regulator [Azospirillum thiophilum]|uniref:response regulator n=1 Tax=Azospirillum thiophilum TaxID=528244 RepID=UPI0009E55887|nr:response regulator [Azospirillum thiophilum]